MNNYMRVACINERQGYKQIQKGDQYLLDRMSIWIDSDGDSYGMVYDLRNNYVGQLKLSHFCSSNPTAIAAKEGKLPPKPPGLSKRERDEIAHQALKEALHKCGIPTFEELLGGIGPY